MQPLILAPSKIVRQTAAADWARATGGRAVLFTDANDADAVRAHAEDAFARIETFRDFAATGLVELRAASMHASTPFSNVVALAETDVMRAARLRARFGLGGLAPEDARLFRDKFAMKRRAAERGIPVTDFALADDALDLIDFIDRHGLPVVVKPVDGRGSAGVRVLRDAADLEAYLASGAFARRESPLVERFVRGDMYQVNGLFLDGACRLVSVVRCVNSNLDFLDGSWLGLVMLDADDPLRERLVRFGHRLLGEAMPMPRDGLFHIEVFHADDDRLLLCEVACRLAGCSCNDQIRHAYGVDVRLEYLRSQCLPEGSPLARAEAVRPERLIAELDVPPAAGELLAQPRSLASPGLRLQKLTGELGRHYGKMAFTNGEIASFLIEGDSTAQLVERVHAVARLYASECAWGAAN
jgi:biotin carboxylase